MEIISMPRPMRWIWGSLGAYWLADIINPGFFSIAIMALLMIPVLILDLYYPQQVAEESSMPTEDVAEELTEKDGAESTVGQSEETSKPEDIEDKVASANEK